ncbi:MAG: prepilin-type N-terminal cleavage/methylation domain-containing protein [Bdellovibrio sp.]
MQSNHFLRFGRRIANRKGMTIIEVMVAIGIMSIVLAGMTTMQINMQKETKALTEKMAVLDLEKFLISTLADGSICTAELTPSILNGSSSFSVNVGNPSKTSIVLPSGIHSSITDPSKVLVQPGALISPLSNVKVKPNGVTVSNFANAGTDLYTATINVEFESDNLVRSLKPISVKTMVNTDPGGKIAACGLGVSAFAGKVTSFGGMFDQCSCPGWGRCQGNAMNGGLYSCPKGYTPNLFSAWDDRGKCGHALYICYK